jgi:hypothetical protein
MKAVYSLSVALVKRLGGCGHDKEVTIGRAELKKQKSEKKSEKKVNRRETNDLEEWCGRRDLNPHGLSATRS